MITHRLLLIVCLLILKSLSQGQNPGIIETRRIAFGSSNAMVFNQSSATYSLQFERTFSLVPRIGLAVYSIDFEYSPTFSTKVTNETTTTNANLIVTTTNSGQNNQLYLMYMATDHALIGLFMPPQLITDQLNLRLPQNSQTFQFNYKQIVSAASVLSNIRVSVFLTGISTNSELTSNGYSANRTYFKMYATKLQIPFYSITVEVQSMFGDITIAQVQYTIIYFDVSMLSSNSSIYAKYLMDSGVTQFTQFGGTATPTTQSDNLPMLPNNPSYQSNTIFYGISSLDCSRGASITVSAYPTVYNNSKGDQFILNAQTWKLSFIALADYSFLQYMTLKCDLPGANCDNKCQNSTTPHFILNGACSYCQYTCLTCNVSNSASVCDSCDITRVLNTLTKKCDCKSGYFDPYQNNYTCKSCYPCATCSNSNQVCLTCYTNLHMIKNSVLSSCQCVSGFYPNYLNGTQTFNQTVPCLVCPQHCLVCLNAAYCLACDLTTYLFAGMCTVVCTSDQLFANQTCIETISTLYDQTGRLGYQWSYIANQSALNITLTFSQRTVQFYYYQNQTAYEQTNSQQMQGSSQTTQFYYDDGKAASSGFQNKNNVAAASSSAALNSQAALSSNSASMQAAAAGTNSSEGGSGGSSTLPVNPNIPGFNYGSVKIQDIDGTYLGLSEQYYYYLAYYYYQKNTGVYAQYTDQYGIPFGKVNISSTAPVKSPNYVDALQNNLVVKVGNDVVPYQITANSNNQFNLVALVSKSYYGEQASLILKNPGLVRDHNIASQLTSVSQPVYIYVCGIQSYINSANSIYHSNKIIVGILWGVGKYPLFIGFGWIFMPLMLTLQYIMSLNYVNTQKPLNLDLFLQSFVDFKNPSIFYDPVRKNMDTSIVNHREMYVNIPFFNRFDRGLDFFKNCFQYFFVPFLSFLLYVLIIGLNKVLNICLRKDIPLISQYIKPRLPLHIAAYTLVQAIGVSFYFFAQLNDTKFSSSNAPNASYPVFNVAMAYLSFFLTCNIPLLLLAFIYFTYTNKQTKFTTGSQLFLVFTQLIKELPTTKNKAFLDDPLWTQKYQKPISYGFSGAVFYMPIFYGFFTSFFYNNFPWQLTGLILTTALFGFFAFENNKFDSGIIKYFWFFLAIFLIAFLFLLSALGSNMSSVPCGQQNLGYLGIGILYALLLMSIIASSYFLWFTCFHLYTFFFKDKHFIVNIDEKPENKDLHSSRNKTHKRRTVNKPSVDPNPSIPPSHHNIPIPKPPNPNPKPNKNISHPSNDNPDSSNRFTDQIQVDEDIIMRERITFSYVDPITKEFVYISQRSQTQLRFTEQQGKFLYKIPRLYITNNGEIFDYEGNFIDRYINQISKANNPTNFQPNNSSNSSNSSNSPLPQINANNIINMPIQEEQVKTVYTYKINDQIYIKEGQDANGLWIMRNQQTNQIRKIDRSMFLNNGQNYYYESSSETQQNLVQNVNINQNIQIDNQYEQQNQQISSQIQNNIARFDYSRKVKIDNIYYMNIGEENGMVRVYDNVSKKILKVTQETYTNAVIDSFDQLINLNGRDYDVSINYDQGNIELVDASNSSNRRTVNQAQFHLLKEQNQQAFKVYMANKFKPINQASYSTSRSPPPNVKTTVQTQYKQSYPQPPSVQQYSQQSYQQKPTYPQQSYQVTTIPNQMLLLQSKATRESNQQTNKGNQAPNNQYVTSIQNTVKVGGNTTISTSQKYVNDYNTSNVARSKQQIQLPNYSQNTVYQSQNTQQPQLIKQEYKVQTEQEELFDDIDDIVSNSTGPFKLLVFQSNKVQQVDDEVRYNQSDVLFRKVITLGKQVKGFTQQMQIKYPGCVIIMVDLSNDEEFKLN